MVFAELCLVNCNPGRIMRVCLPITGISDPRTGDPGGPARGVHDATDNLACRVTNPGGARREFVVDGHARDARRRRLHLQPALSEAQSPNRDAVRQAARAGARVYR